MPISFVLSDGATLRDSVAVSQWSSAFNGFTFPEFPDHFTLPAGGGDISPEITDIYMTH